MANKLYVAYGSNLNLTQMAHRCPNAKVVGKGILKDYQLTFRHVATIEPEKGAETPVGVWEITPACEKALDIYEGYPRMYDGEPCLPSEYYYGTIRCGYADVGLDEKYLYTALADTVKRMQK